MAAVRKLADPDSPLTDLSVERRSDTRSPLSLADGQSAPRPSPARMLQAELQRALTPGPVDPGRFSKRRAMKFIAPASLSFGLFVTLINHIGHH